MFVSLPSLRTQRPGMSLLEVIVVLALVAALMATATYSIGLLDNSRLKAEALRMSGTIIHIYGRAAINGMRYQLVIDLDENAYWAECSDTNIPLGRELLTAAQHNRQLDDEERDAHRMTRQRYGDNDRETDPFGLNLNHLFDDCTEPLIPRRTLEEGFAFDSVMTTHQLEPFERGQVTIGFFANGFVEQSIIWLSQGDAVITLFVHPMTGRVTIENGRSEIPRNFLDQERAR